MQRPEERKRCTEFRSYAKRESLEGLALESGLELNVQGGKRVRHTPTARVELATFRLDL